MRAELSSSTLYTAGEIGGSKENIGRGTPRHVAIIPDRNRRWGKEQDPPLSSERSYRIGAQRIIDSAEEAGTLGVEFLSVVLATDDNLAKRSGEELSGLVDVISEVFLETGLPDLIQKGVKIKLSGRRTLSEDAERNLGLMGTEKYYQLMRGFGKLEDESQDNTGVTFVIGINYGGDAEIDDAFASASKEGVPLTTKADLKQYTHTSQSGAPDIDWLIRTGGETEQRTNGFWPLHLKNCEFDFPDISWPEFTRERFRESVQKFGMRKRTDGG